MRKNLVEISYIELNTWILLDNYNKFDFFITIAIMVKKKLYKSYNLS